MVAKHIYNIPRGIPHHNLNLNPKVLMILVNCHPQKSTESYELLLAAVNKWKAKYEKRQMGEANILNKVDMVFDQSLDGKSKPKIRADMNLVDHRVQSNRCKIGGPWAFTRPVLPSWKVSLHRVDELPSFLCLFTWMSCPLRGIHIPHFLQH